MLNDEISLEQIAKIVTGDNDIKIIDDTIKPEYKCDCSREKKEKKRTYSYWRKKNYKI